LGILDIFTRVPVYVKIKGLKNFSHKINQFHFILTRNGSKLTLISTGTRYIFETPKPSDNSKTTLYLPTSEFCGIPKILTLVVEVVAL